MANLQELMDEITQIQKTEEQLYNVLTRNAQNVALGKESTLTDSEIEIITNQINSLTNTRVNLYNALSKNYRQGVLLEHSAQKSLKQQEETMKILERELNNSKENLAKLKDDKYNQLKMIEINSYFSKQYDSHVKLMKLITITGMCMLSTILLKYIPPLEFLSIPLFNVVTIVGLGFILKLIIDIYSREGDNYDEYIWSVAPKTTKELTDANAESTSFIDISGGGIPFCLGANCCSKGTKWDEESFMCILDAKK
jgi:hypothetical protein